MKVLLDTNVLIDYMVSREPFTSDARNIILLCKNKEADGYLAAHSIMNTFFILRHDYSVSDRRSMLLDFCKFLTVEGIDQKKIIASLENEDFYDVEDCLQTECAINCGADYIVTRNVKDFQNSSVPAILPNDFLKLIND